MVVCRGQVELAVGLCLSPYVYTEDIVLVTGTSCSLCYCIQISCPGVTGKIMVNYIFSASVAALCDYVLQVMYSAHVFIAVVQQPKKMVKIKLSTKST